MIALFVDTSGWYSFIDAKDASHAAVRDHIENAGRLVTTNYIVDETVTLVARRRGHRAAVQIGSVLRDSEQVQTIWVEPDIEQEAWSLFSARPDKKYSLTDCTSFIVMRRFGLTTVVATDRDFAREGFVVVP